MYVVAQTHRSYVDQAGITRLYDPDNVGAGALAGGCGCHHQGGVLSGFLPASATAKAALAVGGIAAIVGGVLLYRRAKGRR